MRDAVRETLVARLSDFDAVVELGVGRRTAVARDLATAGVDVTATDLRERTVPEGVAFVVDDLTTPDRSVYAGADALYARNLPPELHRPAGDLAREVGVPLCFTTLGADQPAVPAERETLPGTTLFVVSKDS